MKPGCMNKPEIWGEKKKPTSYCCTLKYFVQMSSDSENTNVSSVQKKLNLNIKLLSLYMAQ